jgi:arginase family enzyme
MAGFNVPRCFTDKGDVASGANVDRMLAEVANATKSSLSAGRTPFILGGAHTLTLGSLRAAHAYNPNFSLIYFDAHPDLMPHPDINYGSSLYYAIKEGLIAPDRIALIGIRQAETPELEFIKQNKINLFTARDVAAKGLEKVINELHQKLKGPYFISVDLDGIDPAFAPGVTTPYPLGLAPREVECIAAEFAKELLVGEIVEHAPANDRMGRTAYLAAGILRSMTEAASNS